MVASELITEKINFKITHESFLELGIHPYEAVEYLENKKAITINPIHVTALLLLRQPVVSS